MKHVRHHTNRNVLSYTSENLLQAAKFLRPHRDNEKAWKATTWAERADLALAYANVADALIDLANLLTPEDLRPLHAYNERELEEQRGLMSLAQIMRKK